VLNDVIATGTAAGCGIEGGSDKAALPLAISATETPCSPSAVARGAFDVFGAGGRRCCPTDLDRRSGALDAERTEASEPGPDPTTESAHSERR
jgi:hypothetical protein